MDANYLAAIGELVSISGIGGSLLVAWVIGILARGRGR